ncbi:hypothetical protein BC828DRAFT_346539 [Blastocladiella britannica]|nr:hypothetical protein BC828DRAFT_346539 [Blastocladiella britannica]
MAYLAATAVQRQRWDDLPPSERLVHTATAADSNGAAADVPFVPPRILNLLSLEITGTALAQHVSRPRAVSDLDLVDKVAVGAAAPSSSRRLYVHMAMARSYTDFHVDCGGSSVFCHVFAGKTVIFALPPTAANLDTYQQWLMGGKQGSLAELVGKCFEFAVSEGQTVFIPSGWIHAVYTPVDSLVVGGHFLHDHAFEMQCRVHRMQIEAGLRPELLFV